MKNLEMRKRERVRERVRESKRESYQIIRILVAEETFRKRRIPMRKKVRNVSQSIPLPYEREPTTQRIAFEEQV